MPSPFDLLVEIIHSKSLSNWKDRNEKALAALFGSRYPKRAEKAVALRAPDMGGNEKGVAYAAYIDPSNADSGAYGGMSFVLFPVEDAPCLVGMIIGTQGLAPDERILGRPGHARKIQAICKWLNQDFNLGGQVAWAKQDPTRTDIDIPDAVQREWNGYQRVFDRYGKVLYAVYRPTDDPGATVKALAAMLDVMFEERGHAVLKEFENDAEEIRSRWFSFLMPFTNQQKVAELLASRRFAVIQGPPGTGKTRMARKLLAEEYEGFGQTIQFHPNTTYENFIGGLAPVEGESTLGFRFAPKCGFLLEAAAAAAANPTRNYLLHIDEMNRADLGKILGEAIYLLEPDAEEPRELQLAHDFGAPFFRNLKLPENLHILGTMNSADRSIAILDVAVRRRFAFLSLWPSIQVVEEYGCKVNQEAFKNLLAIFIEHAPDDALALVPGHSYFLGLDPLVARRNLTTSLLPLLSEYLAQRYVTGFAESIRSYMQWIECL